MIGSSQKSPPETGTETGTPATDQQTNKHQQNEGRFSAISVPTDTEFGKPLSSSSCSPFSHQEERGGIQPAPLVFFLSQQGI